jgi:hypothetical protein
VLAAGVLGTVALAAGGLTSGCSVLVPEEPEALTQPDADTLRTVAGESLDLARRYDEAVAETPEESARLTPIRDAHREHAAAIGRSLDASVAPTAASATPAASAPASGLKGLQAAERAAAERAIIACLSVAGYYAPMLGAIAAARASHAEALS